jgi:hypothetical protein
MKIDAKEIEYEPVDDWINVAQNKKWSGLF